MPRVESKDCGTSWNVEVRTRTTIDVSCYSVDAHCTTRRAHAGR